MATPFEENLSPDVVEYLKAQGVYTPAPKDPLQEEEVREPDIFDLPSPDRRYKKTRRRGTSHPLDANKMVDRENTAHGKSLNRGTTWEWEAGSKRTKNGYVVIMTICNPGGFGMSVERAAKEHGCVFSESFGVEAKKRGNTSTGQVGYVEGAGHKAGFSD